MTGVQTCALPIFSFGGTSVDCCDRLPSLSRIVDGRKTEASSAAGGGLPTDYCEASHEHRADVAGDGTQVRAAKAEEANNQDRMNEIV